MVLGFLGVSKVKNSIFSFFLIVAFQFKIYIESPQNNLFHFPLKVIPILDIPLSIINNNNNKLPLFNLAGIS